MNNYKKTLTIDEAAKKEKKTELIWRHIEKM